MALCFGRGGGAKCCGAWGQTGRFSLSGSSGGFCRLQSYETGFLALGCFLWVLWCLHSRCDVSFILIRFWLALQKVDHTSCTEVL